MTLDHGLPVLKLIVAAIGAIIKREKAPTPVAVTPSSSALALNFDSKDMAIFCLGVALVFSTLAVISLTAAPR